MTVKVAWECALFLIIAAFLAGGCAGFRKGREVGREQGEVKAFR